MTIAALDRFTNFRDAALIDQMNRGIAASSFAQLAKLVQVPVEEFAGLLGLSPRTMRNRLTLTATETELAYRVYRVFRRAEEVLEDGDTARAWLVTPQRALGNRPPMSFLIRDVGVAEVMNLLGAIEDGGYL